MPNTITNYLRRFFLQRNMVNRLIAVNVAVFLIISLFNFGSFVTNYAYPKSWLTNELGLPASWHSLLFHPWSIITYAFTHEAFLHILFNMLWLYWLGNIFSDFLGNKRLLPVYLMGSVAGGVLYVLAYNLLPVFRPEVNSAICIGASAGVLAIVIAAATQVPDYTVYLMFIGPVKLKWIALITISLDVISIPSENAGGHIAHLGGALFGFAFVKQVQNGNDWTAPLNRFFDWVTVLFQKIPGMRVSYSFPDKKQKRTEKVKDKKQEHIDAILDKIAKEGYENLTREEKDFLFNASKE